MKPVISISGIRGIIGESLTPEVIAKFAASFGTYIKGGKVVVGRDTRLSGEMAKYAVFSGLLSTGCEIVDLGIVPTPTVQLLTEKLKANGGIAITASHNPQEYNGLKFISSNGTFLNSSQVKPFLDIYLQNKIKYLPFTRDTIIKNYHQEAIDFHLKKTLSLLNSSLIRKSHFSVALDCCNGAGSVIAPLLLKKLGCRVFIINDKLNKTFPRPPEPLPENLLTLGNLVKKKADIGFALDPDADRLAIISEKGKAIGEDYTLGLATKFILSKSKGPVVTNLSTSQIMEHITGEFNCSLFRSRVGEINVVEEMKKRKAIIGGEGNGGVIFPSLHHGRDSLIGMGLILQYLSERRKTVSQLVEEIPSYKMLKKKISLPRPGIKKVISKIKKYYHAEKINLLDGIRVTGKDWWLHLRPSGTEPISRLIIEARTEKQIKNLYQSIAKLIAG
ncbi:MAG: phosphoglucosamine mutase [bacterium (Candidatus Ratteibacteria) CG_4_10_14_3_um_filter_41_18]|uniref:Phosphoglucosamine mutase n=3 Tax=Candidatus Ratteibacteria TaxID=2979319 RepID=A0A2M7E8J6_9BACT|nr:MAG: phosphoglucosamine mutase [Candidatus Omnitrophica bacterium CG1_02_41_171]PIV64062.1 MAG: phosphoglucosamine mutase [bacterium (Candidatus Ratteibacteria) CG01_land_8_20_14_3_00_40_19]PIW33288.1 MAG: phosphoglucosamine mutase [bacterium (Candidatus Ratteibacteria) CG15_BIG_FIL_POST_REV_8_21_14_020_41_12]PIW74119.1 MAG: phosphoglucosamine mutase [bacterium (Candidatus Ratteibacteria) CG_4_8_14_3_um_filter_41_36]PIX77142.1 MAG: phosphoglucosamine mutase [bacterium (Candidatus Ratteibacte